MFPRGRAGRAHGPAVAARRRDRLADSACVAGLVQHLLQQNIDSSPFLLFDDATGGGKARVFTQPRAVFRADRLDEVARLLEQVRAAGAAGFWCAGFLAYEAGFALEPKMRALDTGRHDGPLGWFAAFDRPYELDAEELAHELPRTAPITLDPQPRISPGSYRASVREVLDYIGRGDIYQMNLTFQAELGSLRLGANGQGPAASLGLYRRLRERQKAAFGGVVSTGAETCLCFSPELFFSVRDGLVTTRPMKGTAPRQSGAVNDAETVELLRADPKNRAENLMIVDLMRNDLGRIAVAGSVKVPELFRIETYPTVHQMTSTVTAALRSGLDPVSVLEALFPCGSITGAPKMRAMELIRGIERAPRGLYTGSIGWIAPDGDALFNVAIRTITVDADGRGRLGLGSGIVADSDPDDEWAECLQKAKFLQNAPSMGFRMSNHYKRGL